MTSQAPQQGSGERRRHERRCGSRGSAGLIGGLWLTLCVELDLPAPNLRAQVVVDLETSPLIALSPLSRRRGRRSPSRWTSLKAAGEVAVALLDGPHSSRCSCAARTHSCESGRFRGFDPWFEEQQQRLPQAMAAAWRSGGLTLALRSRQRHAEARPGRPKRRGPYRTGFVGSFAPSAPSTRRFQVRTEMISRGRNALTDSSGGYG